MGYCSYEVISYLAFGSITPTDVYEFKILKIVIYLFYFWKRRVVVIEHWILHICNLPYCKHSLRYERRIAAKTCRAWKLIYTTVSSLKCKTFCVCPKVILCLFVSWTLKLLKLNLVRWLFFGLLNAHFCFSNNFCTHCFCIWSPISICLCMHDMPLWRGLVRLLFTGMQIAFVGVFTIF